MKTLHIKNGFEYQTDGGYRKVTSRHFGDFIADDFSVDDDGNETKTGTLIVTANEIKNAVHEATGKAFDAVAYDEDEIDYFEAAAELMDDEIREQIHADLAPCTEEEFLAEYCRRHEKKYGEQFEI